MDDKKHDRSGAADILQKRILEVSPWPWVSSTGCMMSSCVIKS